MAHKLKLFSSLLLIATVVCGCPGTNQFTLPVEGKLVITSSEVETFSSVSEIEPQQQVLTGVVIVDVTQNEKNHLGIDVRSLDVTTEEEIDEALKICLPPEINTSGVLYKLDVTGTPLGLSSINIQLAVTTNNNDILLIETDSTWFAEDGKTLILGEERQAVADSNDWKRLPVLGKIPVINYLFKTEERQAEITELVILLTPEIINILEE